MVVILMIFFLENENEYKILDPENMDLLYLIF